MSNYTMIYESLVAKFKNRNSQNQNDSSIISEKITRTVTEEVTYAKVEEA